ncbi:MAG TPA: hypothetical protein EYP24_04755 [bacterium (Candidatus Stahlbacteria)]|nr:hypothetical protein [Candidatus Stahlbacteria bacterium]
MVDKKVYEYNLHMSRFFSGNQKTIKRKGKITDLTIEGEKTTLYLYPFDKGIVFRRGKRTYHLNPEAVMVKKNRVFIGPIGMIEHLLFSLFLFGVDNILIESQRDLPIFDGSALGYYHLIKDIGIIDLRRKRRLFRFREAMIRKRESTIITRDDDKVAMILSYHPEKIPLSKTRIRLKDPHDLIQARTFVFTSSDDPRIRNYRFGIGITEKGCLPDLRHPDEPIRHKLLDLIGDLYTTGRPFTARIEAINPNHRINIALVKNQWRRDDSRGV